MINNIIKYVQVPASFLNGSSTFPAMDRLGEEASLSLSLSNNLSLSLNPRPSLLHNLEVQVSPV